MFKLALELSGPAAIRYPREICPEIETKVPLELGKGEILFDGKDGIILAYGVMVKYALIAREILLNEGIDIGVANGRFAKPVDADLVSELIIHYPFVLCVEDHTYQGGFGSAVLETAALKGLDSKKIKLLSVPDKFIDHGPRELLLKLLCLDGEGIAKACRILNENPKASSEVLYMSDLVQSAH
jgi:1-deoxy-D-xylulose-5-phosphate synthase